MNIPDEQVNEAVVIEFGADYDPTKRDHETFLAGMLAGVEWARKEALREAFGAVGRLYFGAGAEEALDAIRALAEGEGRSEATDSNIINPYKPTPKETR